EGDADSQAPAHFLQGFAELLSYRRFGGPVHRLPLPPEKGPRPAAWAEGLPGCSQRTAVGTKRSMIPMTNAASSAPRTVTCMPGTMNWAAQITTAETMNPTSPRRKGETPLPNVDSATQPSAAMTTAASSALKKFIVLNPGRRKPTNISTRADTMKRTIVPSQSNPITSRLPVSSPPVVWRAGEIPIPAPG